MPTLLDELTRLANNFENVKDGLDVVQAANELLALLPVLKKRLEAAEKAREALRKIEEPTGYCTHAVYMSDGKPHCSGGPSVKSQIESVLSQWEDDEK